VTELRPKSEQQKHTTGMRLKRGGGRVTKSKNERVGNFPRGGGPRGQRLDTGEPAFRGHKISARPYWGGGANFADW